MQDERLITEFNFTFHISAYSVFLDLLQWMADVKELRVMGLETMYWKRLLLVNKHRTEVLEEQKKRRGGK